MSSTEPRVLWIPGKGPNPEALDRLKEHFRQPRSPMGGAWVMSGERKLFTDRSDRDLSQIPAQDLAEILFEITSGTSSFGAQEEWRSWFHFLLPRLVDRAFESTGGPYLLESIVSAFVVHHPKKIDEAYEGFKDDVLATLPLSIMGPNLWSEGSLAVGRLLCRRPESPALPWGWHAPSGDLSSAMFFCLKYLDPFSLSEWLGSITSIQDPYWGAQVLAWLVAFYRLVDLGIGQPAEFESVDPGAGWEGSGCLTGHFTGDHSDPTRIPFLNKDSVRAFLTAVQQHITEDRVLSWADSFSRLPSLEAEAASTADDFLRLHQKITRDRSPAEDAGGI